MRPRICPACRGPLRVESNGYYGCPCGVRVHEFEFLRDRGEPIGDNPEPKDPPLPDGRKAASWMAHDIVMAATEFIEKWAEAGLLSGNPEQIRQRIAEAANDAVYEAWKPTE